MSFPLIKQAIVIPLAVMLVPILIALFVPGYSSLSQHISESALLDSPIASIQRTAAIVAGISMLLFGIGVFRVAPARLWFTTVTAVIAGVCMASNGVFVMGSPLHGLFGLGGFSLMLVPAFFAAEIHHSAGNKALRQVSLLVSAVSVLYIWMMVVGLDPAGFRGLTQRLFTVIYFGWYSFASYWLLYRADAPGELPPASHAEELVAG